MQYVCVGVTEDNIINILDKQDGAVDSCTPEQVVNFIEQGLQIQGIEFNASSKTLKITVQSVTK